ncbi:phytanoyl-CoA dioxygenase family protein [Kitasatospora sp. NBC_01287]|uniref:phytanoyl-CoA dioxygenase family protein n=1 Tax=Kitasatospora sp. NBC_01287 TaxID=2903573 RepID=UPI00224CFF28|nr:phytanoyl-CoA dioxygenase family protein [Kitasatospora sp. NBC_01287]MCX4750374.1 phytanoyl-CoA dioxygenase family protein [Kitasatospora sp. NBC_01287]
MALATLHEAPLGGLRLRDALDGRLLVVRGALDLLAPGESARRAALASVAATVSPQAAGKLDRSGLEQLHLVADAGQIRSVRDELDRRLRPAAEQLLLRFAGALPPQRRRLYVSSHLGVRIMSPQATVRGREAELGDYTGFLLPTLAHTDSWFNTAVNSVNLWLAVSRVRRDNGLTLWPQAYRRPLRHDGVRLLAGQAIGEPVEVELEAGDLLVFAGDQLHATRPNTGPETRWVVTKRLCLGPPRYHPRATGWVPYLDPRLLDTPLRALAPARSALTLGGLRQLGREADRLLTRLRH